MNPTVEEPYGNCIHCGGQLVSHMSGCIQGTYCVPCQKWYVVATYMPPIMLDQQEYAVILQAADILQLGHLRVLAEICNLNFLQVRALLLQEPHPVLFNGFAMYVGAVIEKLQQAGITYRISPEFPW